VSDLRMVVKLPADLSDNEREEISQLVGTVVNDFLLERAIRLVKAVNDAPPIPLPLTKDEAA
jgi:hypothetical protein